MVNSNHCYKPGCAPSVCQDKPAITASVLIRDHATARHTSLSCGGSFVEHGRRGPPTNADAVESDNT